jgi:hypothetical protein
MKSQLEGRTSKEIQSEDCETNFLTKGSTSKEIQSEDCETNFLTRDREPKNLIIQLDYGEKLLYRRSRADHSGGRGGGMGQAGL